MRISILDQSPIENNSTAEVALSNSIELAKLAEKLGYYRFWVSEHHGADRVAGSSPEVLIAHLLAHTSRIRIGSGGVMLQHYSPFKVAENFHVMSNLAPGRVDLGVGKAPGGLQKTTQALQIEVGGDYRLSLDEKLAQLSQYVTRGNELRAEPHPKIAPELFLLGASAGSAATAAIYDYSYVFARFITNDMKQLKDALEIYRRKAPYGKFILALPVFVADTLEGAHDETANLLLWKVHLQDGSKVTVTSEAQATAFGNQSGQSYEIECYQQEIISGTEDVVKEEIDRILFDFPVDELVFHTPVPSFAKRKRSYERLAGMFTTYKEEVK